MPVRLFIADTDECHIRNVQRCVARCPDIAVVGTGANGAHVLRQLSMSPADILITEIQLPGLDGIMLLRELQGLRSRPAAVVCTHFYSPVCVSKAWACGAAYFLYKPLDYHRLPEIIRECQRVRLQSSTDAPDSRAPLGKSQAEVIRAMISEMGMPAKLTGSMALSEALAAAREDPTLLKNLSKGLYAVVAERMQSTPARLERSLRNAIGIACQRGGLDRRFGHCPTNRELLMYMMEELALRNPQ